MKWLKLLMLLAGLLDLAGCTSSGSVQRVSPLICNKPFDLDLILVKTTSSSSNLAAEEQMLNDAIASGLRDTHLFKNVSDNRADLGPGSGVIIEADIMKIRKIPKNKRLWEGALAGRARILVSVTISDLNTGKQMETFETAGQSSGGSALAGTTDEAIERAAEEVVNAVVKINSETAQ
jgi:hypothetical protein